MKKIDCGSSEEFDGQWLDRADRTEKKYSLSSVISNSGCGEYFQLEFIQSYESLKILMPLISLTDVAILIRDADGEPVVLSYFENEKSNRTWISAERRPFNDTQLRNIHLFGSDEFRANGYSCTYFVQKPMAQIEKQMEKIGVEAYCEKWSKLAEGYFACRHELFVDLSNGEEENEGVVYKIYRDILRRFPHSTLKEGKGFLDLWEAEKKGAISSKLRGQILGVITDTVQKLDFQDISKDKLPSHIKDNIAIALEENWDALCGEGTIEDRISNEMQGLN